MHIASIGIDLGKTTFHLVALGERNKVLVRKKVETHLHVASWLSLSASRGSCSEVGLTWPTATMMSHLQMLWIFKLTHYAHGMEP